MPSNPGAAAAALQAMLAIDAMGLSGTYEAWLAAPERTFAERQFALRAQTWERMNPVFLAVIDMLEKTDAEADQFIEYAKTL
jgi:hypothetical protein